MNIDSVSSTVGASVHGRLVTVLLLCCCTSSSDSPAQKMAAVVLRLALCLVGAGDNDAETITTAAKELWPHWSWLAIGRHRDGIMILAQNAGKNITVNKAIKDLLAKLPDHLQDIRLFKASSDYLCTEGVFFAQFGTFSRAGKRKADFIRTYVDEGNIVRPSHPSVLTAKEIANEAADDVIRLVLQKFSDHLYMKDHEQNEHHIENRHCCPECALDFNIEHGF